jgi:hypothetical protein
MNHRPSRRYKPQMSRPISRPIVIVRDKYGHTEGFQFKDTKSAISFEKYARKKMHVETIRSIGIANQSKAQQKPAFKGEIAYTKFKK